MGPTVGTGNCEEDELHHGKLHELQTRPHNGRVLDERGIQ